MLVYCYLVSACIFQIAKPYVNIEKMKISRNHNRLNRLVRRTLIYLLVLSFTAGIAQGYEQDLNGSRIEFEIRNMGLTVKGEFTDFNIETNLMMQDLESSYLKASISVVSIDTGIRKRNKSLGEEKYFNIKEFPEIQFQSESFHRDADGNITMKGRMKIKSTGLVMTLPMEVEEEGEALRIVSQFEVNRRDFDIGGKSWLMADRVEVKVTYKGKR